MPPTEIPPEPGRKLAFLITVVMHGLLLLALFLSVQWKTEYAAVEVELWSPAPRPAAAPPRRESLPAFRPPEPAPAKTPDIALRKDKEKKETPRAKPVAPDFRELLRREEQEKRGRERADQEARLLAEAEAEQRAVGLKAAEDAWSGQIRSKIRGNIVVLPLNIQGNPEAVFEINLLPNGEVIRDQVRLLTSSGNPALDEAIGRAIAKSSPLPKPGDPAAFKRRLTIIYRPYDN
jgi:colicin import membrane protein